MAAWCAGRSTADVLAALESAGIPAGPVYSPQDALDDASIAGFLEPLDYPGAPAPAQVGGFPVDLSATPGRIHGRAPLLGEHTDDVLGELGYDAAQVAELRAAGVV